MILHIEIFNAKRLTLAPRGNELPETPPVNAWETHIVITGGNHFIGAALITIISFETDQLMEVR